MCVLFILQESLLLLQIDHQSPGNQLVAAAFFVHGSDFLCWLGTIGVYDGSKLTMYVLLIASVRTQFFEAVQIVRSVIGVAKDAM